jgi:hypothetical protein
LKNKSDLSASDFSPLGVTDCRQILSVDQDLSAGR